ncbi:MAG: hypothetical protein ACLUEK_15760 [Oscillospiraceae bacterium]
MRKSCAAGLEPEAGASPGELRLRGAAGRTCCRDMPKALLRAGRRGEAGRDGGWSAAGHDGAGRLRGAGRQELRLRDTDARRGPRHLLRRAGEKLRRIVEELHASALAASRQGRWTRAARRRNFWGRWTS